MNYSKNIKHKNVRLRCSLWGEKNGLHYLFQEHYSYTDVFVELKEDLVVKLRTESLIESGHKAQINCPSILSLIATTYSIMHAYVSVK